MPAHDFKAVAGQIKERVETLERHLEAALSIIGSVTGSNRKDRQDGYAFGHTCCFGIDGSEAEVLEMAHKKREDWESERAEQKAHEQPL